MKETEGIYRTLRFFKQLLIGALVLVFGLFVFGYAVFMRQTDARAAWAAAEREIHSGVLRFGERVERKAKVFQRRPTDYYRGSHGILFATNERLIFIGQIPTDKLENTAAPARIVVQDIPNDTALQLARQRVYFMTSSGVIARRVGHVERYAASKGEKDALTSLVAHVNTRHATQRALAAREKRLREAVARIIKEPIQYSIKRGDALSTIAGKFETTPENLRAWNKLPNDKVRIGDKLIVKPST
jgi:LysM repeat protein